MATSAVTEPTRPVLTTYIVREDGVVAAQLEQGFGSLTVKELDTLDKMALEVLGFDVSVLMFQKAQVAWLGVR